MSAPIIDDLPEYTRRLIKQISALEAHNQQLREALTKIRDGDSDCECNDHTDPECCATIEWNDGKCCPHCVAGAALAATEPKETK